MSIKRLGEISKRIRDAAGRAYIEQRHGKRERVQRRETDEEIREAMRGWMAAESAS